jgi:hypothetical protein
MVFSDLQLAQHVPNEATERQHLVAAGSLSDREKIFYILARCAFQPLWPLL